ncbi:MAG: hypothetical protein ACPIOQ_73195 [Promethearchaeia archaeon]
MPTRWRGQIGRLTSPGGGPVEGPRSWLVYLGVFDWLRSGLDKKRLTFICKPETMPGKGGGGLGLDPRCVRWWNDA